MTEKQQELLTNDLCGRLPYRVKIKTNYFQTATLISLRKNISLDSGKDLSITFDISGKDEPFQMEERWGTPISEIKPYLIPLSCMTEAQMVELYKVLGKGYENHFHLSQEWNDFKDSISKNKLFLPASWIDDLDKVINWFNRNHFDYRGLIEMGLALKAPDGMYKQNI